MPRVIFTKPFQFQPTPRLFQFFEVTGEPVLITTPAAEAAIAAGAARKVANPEEQ